jgi:3,4-dihydroxy 2-butanone 4-phosphate synthase / GTP cyclohydrolase II
VSTSQHLADDRRRPGQARWDQVHDAIDAIRRGEIVVVVDDEHRENEGDLVMAAEKATPEKLAFFIEHTSGLICVPMDAARADDLALPPMVATSTERMGTAFTVSVDGRHHTTTGISGYDRCTTIRALADPATKPDDLARPGHVFPLRAAAGGVLQRVGHTEAAVDLSRLAGLEPVGVICEIVDERRTGMARAPELERFAAEHGLRMISIADLIRHRRRVETQVRRVERTTVPIPTAHGTFEMSIFESILDGAHHVVLSMGAIAGAADVLVRVHSECLTGDIFGSLRCDCGDQLDAAMRRIAAAGQGVIVYLRGHEGRGIGLSHKLRAYALQDRGFDTLDANLVLGLPADNREFGTGAQILAELGVTTMRLMTNNPAKYDALSAFGLEITERVKVVTASNPHNLAYLRTKRERMGHLIEGTEDPPADDGVGVTS